MIAWIFDRPSRAYLALISIVVLGVTIAVIVLSVRVHGITRAVQHGTGTEVTRDERLVGTPASTPSLTLSTPTASTFPSLGDPRPIVLDVVQAWIDGKPDVPHVSPAALEDLSAHAAPTGLYVTGTARLNRSGPTAALVIVPTTLGGLAVDVALSDGDWSVTGVGWDR